MTHDFVTKMGSSGTGRLLLTDRTHLRTVLEGASAHHRYLPLLDTFEADLILWANGMKEESVVKAAKAALLDALESTGEYNTETLWNLPLQREPIPAI